MNEHYKAGREGQAPSPNLDANQRAQHERGAADRRIWGPRIDPPRGGSPVAILGVFAIVVALPVLLTLLGVSVLAAGFALFAAVFGGVVTYLLSRHLFSNRQVSILDSFKAAFFGYAAAGVLVSVCWFAGMFLASQSPPETFGSDIFSALKLQARTLLESNDVLASLAMVAAPGLRTFNLDANAPGPLAQLMALAIAFLPAFLANAGLYQRFVGAPLRGAWAFPSSLGAASLILLLSFGLMNAVLPVVSETAYRVMNAGAIAESERGHADHQRLSALFPERIGEFALTERYGLPPIASANYADPSGRVIEVRIHRPGGDVDFTSLYSPAGSGEGAVVETLNGRPAKFVRASASGRTEYSVLVGRSTQVIASAMPGAQAERMVRAAVNGMPMDAIEEIVSSD
ncbi:MAG: hypothetical protein AB7O98_16375 [Hyphomonadaceae bacterium]